MTIGQVQSKSLLRVQLIFKGADAGGVHALITAAHAGHAPHGDTAAIALRCHDNDIIGEVENRTKTQKDLSYLVARRAETFHIIQRASAARPFDAIRRMRR